MPHIDHHPQGSFCWIELATTDQNAGKAFYRDLFGWAVNDMPMGPDEAYTIFRLEGRDAAAGCTLRKEQLAQGVPPHWTLYIAVDNVDASAKRAAEAGATVFGPPFDVMDAGRMAVVQDPTGAVFCMWQAKGNKGIGIAGVDGTLCWADLSSPDQKGAAAFYSKIFGWELTTEQGTTGYLHIKNGESMIGGILPPEQRNPNAPPHWMPYFQVSNCDAFAAKAKSLGAKFLMPPMTMENVGRFAVVADPQGAAFSLFQSARK